MFDVKLKGFAPKHWGDKLENRLGNVEIKNNEENKPLINFFLEMFAHRDTYFGSPYIRTSKEDDRIIFGMTTFQLAQSLFGYYSPEQTMSSLSELTQGDIENRDWDFLSSADTFVEYAFIANRKTGLNLKKETYRGNISFVIAGLSDDVRNEVYERIPKSWFNLDWFEDYECNKISMGGDWLERFETLKYLVKDPRIIDITGQKGIRPEFNKGKLVATINHISFKEGYSSVSEKTKKLHSKLFTPERVFYAQDSKVLANHRKNVLIDKPILAVVPFNKYNVGKDLPELTYEGIMNFYEKRNLPFVISR